MRENPSNFRDKDAKSYHPNIAALMKNKSYVLRLVLMPRVCGAPLEPFFAAASLRLLGIYEHHSCCINPDEHIPVIIPPISCMLYVVGDARSLR
jgi:hypothetical protein